ncbi:hypothetical protein PSUM_27095 [Pseudomonas umsongensis]|uniref:Uncharacterized protein n=1 Tax=Pseudomonas umsongensis TaxID=198618 RepID=A0ABX4DQ53_9PSED|nr:hypothetical protein PSUM_27095 [Pseudomonas umsongensis]
MLPDSFVSVVLASSRAGSLPQGIGGDQKTVGASLLAKADCQAPNKHEPIIIGFPCRRFPTVTRQLSSY